MDELEIKTMKLSDLKGWERNPRRISDKAMEGLKASLERWGVVQPIVWNKQTGRIVGGHQRVVALKKLGKKTAQVLIVDLPESEEKALNVSLNNPHIAGEFTEDLTIILEEIKVEIPGMDFELFQLGDIEIPSYEPPIIAGMADPDEVPDPPEEPISKTGDLWLLGEHRLLCGDCTKAEDVERVMDGKRAQMGLTSPPYAVGKEYEKGVTFEQHLELLRNVAKRGLDAITPGGFFFVNFDEIAAQSHAGPITGAPRQCLYLISLDYWRIFRELAYELYAQRVWYKPFNRLKQPFWTYHTSIPHYQEWEPIWTWRIPGGDGDDVYDWDISSRAVWDTRAEATEDRPLTRHVAAFPVGIPERAMRAHSAKGHIVWEPFSGSGTTIIAAETLNRRCYAIEIEPRYVDVAVKRWEQFTGKKAVLA